MQKNQAIMLSMPLVSHPFMQLLKNTIEPAKNAKQLAEMLEKNIKIAPGASCYTITKGDKQLEMYISLENKDFDVSANMTEAVKEMSFTGPEYKGFLEQAGQLVTFVIIYYESIKERVPDIFKKIKTSLNLTDDDSFESVYVSADRKMYLSAGSTKCLCVKFKAGPKDKVE
jgi:hypothetical protein